MMSVRTAVTILAFPVALLGPLTACSHATGPDPSSTTTTTGAVVPANEVATPAATRLASVYKVPVDGLPFARDQGNDAAPVTMVVFTDYTCPYCERAEGTLARLQDTYGDALRVVVDVRALPSDNEAASRPASLAALAASRQGKFAAMNASLRALFTGAAAAKTAVDRAQITSAAAAAGLDMSRFPADEEAARPALAAAEGLASSLGIRGAPSFFINGKFIAGAQPYAVFTQVIDGELAAARALVKSGVRPEDVYEQTTSTGSPRLQAPDGEGSCDGET